MSMHPRVLAVIPARGGSKGVPRKNLQMVRGKPLIAYSIETALTCHRLFGQVLVSTDDEEIAHVATQYGALVPFRRPAELAGDHVSMVPVLQHAVSWAEQQHATTFEWVCLLQPTSPLRTADDIEACLTCALEDDCDSVISVQRVLSVHPALMKRVEHGRLVPFCVEEKEGTRRQDLMPFAFMRNGAIYLTRRRVLMEEHSIWGKVSRPYVMPEERSINVDSPLDLVVLEALLAQSNSA